MTAAVCGIKNTRMHIDYVHTPHNLSLLALLAPMCPIVSRGWLLYPGKGRPRIHIDAHIFSFLIVVISCSWILTRTMWASLHSPDANPTQTHNLRLDNSHILQRPLFLCISTQMLRSLRNSTGLVPTNYSNVSRPCKIQPLSGAKINGTLMAHIV